MSTARADRQLTALQNVLGLSDAGKAWLTAVIDPFHDEEIKDLSGFPDGLQGRNCIQVVKQTTTVKCPSNVTTGTWDLNINSLPIMEYGNVVPAEFPMSNDPDHPAFQGYSYGPSDVQHLTLSPITCFMGATGTNVNVTGFLQGAGDISVQLVQTPIPLVGSFRCIAKGYEVISAGPELYKSGTIFVWNQPVAEQKIVNTTIATITGAGPPRYKTLDIAFFDLMPANTGEIIEIPNSQSWPAKEGAYIVDKMIGSCQPTDWFSTSAIALVSNEVTTITSTNGLNVNLHSGYVSTINNDTVKVNATTFDYNALTKPMAITDFGISGCYLSGLNLQDVITINVVWYIERLPTVQEPDLMLLSKPTPNRDDVAINTYSALAKIMPVGMYQRSNGFGDWFKDAVSVVADVVAPVASAIPGPIGAVAKGITMAAPFVKKFLPDVKPVNAIAPYSEKPQKREIVVDEGDREVVIRENNKKKKSKLRREDGKALMDLNSLKQELKSMKTKMKKKKKK